MGKFINNKPKLILILIMMGLLFRNHLYAASITSIDISPINPTVNIGQTQPFTATGHYDDGTALTLDSAPVAIATLGSSATSLFFTEHTCILLQGDIRGGQIKCWGGNSEGQLGDGTTDNSQTPVFVSGISNAIAVAIGDGYTCALISDGTVKCWGANNSGQLGDGSNTNHTAPDNVTGITQAIAITLGDGHACAIVSGGAVKCWGENNVGELGDGTTINRSAPVTVNGITNAIEIAAGDFYTCALISDGTVKCWGDNFRGSLGDGTTTTRLSPVTVSGVTGATSIAAGGEDVCVNIGGSQIKCWGDNSNGQLGNGLTSDSSVPVTVSALAQASDTYDAIAVSGTHTCVIGDANGVVQCWGRNDLGQLGDGTTKDSFSAVISGDITGAKAIAAGFGFTCTVLGTGEIKCWGDRTQFDDGSGYAPTYVSPIAVNGITGEESISAGGDTTCVVLFPPLQGFFAPANVECWGANDAGQLGDGTTDKRSGPELLFADGYNEIALAGDHACGRSGGLVLCWGANNAGQLGDGSTTEKLFPVQVSGITTATAIAVADGYSCALLADGSIKCWGSNANFGNLGDGTGTDRAVPVTVTGITTAVAITATDGHACAILFNGVIQCWGANAYGQLGDGTTTNRLSPVSVLGITSAQAVAASSPSTRNSAILSEVGKVGSGIWTGSTCTIISGGTVKCWGENSIGQLGNGTTVDSHAPVIVSGITGATALVATGTKFAFTGSTSFCAIISDGTVKCWGSNSNGQLGDGTVINHSTPVVVRGITNAVKIAAGYTHVCAALEDGAVKCWGDNSVGQAGIGPFSPTPVTDEGFLGTEWTISDSSVASVDGKGIATALGTGATNIIATAGGISGNATLTVGSASGTQTDTSGSNPSTAGGSSSGGGGAIDFTLIFIMVIALWVSFGKFKAVGRSETAGHASFQNGGMPQ